MLLNNLLFCLEQSFPQWKEHFELINIKSNEYFKDLSEILSAKITHVYTSSPSDLNEWKNNLSALNNSLRLIKSINLYFEDDIKLRISTNLFTNIIHLLMETDDLNQITTNIQKLNHISNSDILPNPTIFIGFIADNKIKKISEIQLLQSTLKYISQLSSTDKLLLEIFFNAASNLLSNSNDEQLLKKFLSNLIALYSQNPNSEVIVNALEKIKDFTNISDQSTIKFGENINN